MYLYIFIYSENYYLHARKRLIIMSANLLRMETVEWMFAGRIQADRYICFALPCFGCSSSKVFNAYYISY